MNLVPVGMFSLQKDKQTKLPGEFMKWENITQYLLENLQNNFLNISWTCIKLSGVFMKGHIGRGQAGMKNLLTDLGSFVPGAV